MTRALFALGFSGALLGLATASSEIDRRSFVPVLSTKKDPGQAWIDRVWTGQVTAYGLSGDGKYSVFKTKEFGLAAGEIGNSPRLYFKSINGKNFTAWDPDKLGIPFASTYGIERVVVSGNCRFSLVWLQSNFVSGRKVLRWDAFSNRVVDFGAVFPELTTATPPLAFLSDDGNQVMFAGFSGVNVYNLAAATKRVIQPSLFPGATSIGRILPSANGQYLSVEAKSDFYSGSVYRLRLADDQVTPIFSGLGIPGGMTNDGRYYAGVMYNTGTVFPSQARRFDLELGTSVPIARRLDGPELSPDSAESLVLSANGRWAAFTSTHEDLSGSPTLREDFYVKDLVTGNLTQITDEPLQSAYDRVVAVANNGACVFDQQFHGSATQYLLGGSREPLASPVNFPASAPSSYSRPDGMSADGRFVATLEPEGVYVLDRVSQTRQLFPNTQISQYAYESERTPVVSSDGQFVYAFETSPALKLKRFRIGTTESEDTGLNGPIHAVSSNGQFVLAGAFPVKWKNMNSNRVYNMVGGIADMDPTGRYVFHVDSANSSAISLKDFDTETEVARVISTTTLAQSEVKKVFVSGDGLRYIVSSVPGRSYIFNRVTGSKIQTINDYWDIMAISHDGKQAVVSEKIGSTYVPRQRVLGAATSVGLISSKLDYGSPLTFRLGSPLLVMDNPSATFGPGPISLMTAWER